MFDYVNYSEFICFYRDDLVRQPLVKPWSHNALSGGFVGTREQLAAL